MKSKNKIRVDWEWCLGQTFTSVARGKIRCLTCNRRLNKHSHTCVDSLTDRVTGRARWCWHSSMRPHKRKVKNGLL